MDIILPIVSESPSFMMKFEWKALIAETHWGGERFGDERELWGGVFHVPFRFRSIMQFCLRHEADR